MSKKKKKKITINFPDFKSPEWKKAINKHAADMITEAYNKLKGFDEDREPTKFDYLLETDCGKGLGESIKIKKVEENET